MFHDPHHHKNPHCLITHTEKLHWLCLPVFACSPVFTNHLKLLCFLPLVPWFTAKWPILARNSPKQKLGCISSYMA